MTKKKTPITLEAIRSKINAIEAEKVEPGFYNVSQWAEIWDSSPARTHELLKYAVKHGIMEERKFKVMLENTGLRRCTFYREREET